MASPAACGGGSTLDGLPRLEVVEAAAAAAWEDFLTNRVRLAERRASGWIAPLRCLLAEPQVPTADMPADMEALLITLADLAHIAGAARASMPVLDLALAAYSRVPPRPAVQRMAAETLLRLRRYEEAFAAFAQIAMNEASAVEVAPFRLLHDAECVEDAVRLGADHALLERAAAWRAVAAHLDGAADGVAAGDALHRVRRDSLSQRLRAQLGADYGAPLPLPPLPRGPGPTAMLRARDWGAVARQYAAERAVVIDDLLTDEALDALQAYARHGAPFLTVRRGFLGAFPSDGATHPLLLDLATQLAAACEPVFASHSLAHWWLFKYGEEGGGGIGIHADAAAVNVNVWLTDDHARLDGGGLVVYRHVRSMPRQSPRAAPLRILARLLAQVPALEQPTPAVNREFASEADEEGLRATLSARGEVRRIGYRCNRAVIFVSDQYHETEPFRFKPGYEHRRVNLTLLYGDRWSPVGTDDPVTASSDGIDVFSGAPPAAPPAAVI